MPHERVSYVVFCDQARVENNGKGLYIGAYSGTILVESSFPAFLSSVAIVACVRPVKQREQLRATLHMPGDSKPQTFETEYVSKNPGDSLSWILAISPCVLRAPGEMTFELEFEDGSKHKQKLQVMPASEFKANTWPKASKSGAKS